MIIVAAKVEVIGSSPLGTKIPFAGIGTAISTIEMTARIAKIRYVDGVMDDLKLVFLSSPRFHEYASNGTDNKRVDIMTVS